MAHESNAAATPTLDAWIDEIGQDGVIAAVKRLHASIAAGATPVLRDQDSLQAYWDSRRRQSA